MGRMREDQSEIVVGFDVRRDHEASGFAWDEGRRFRYLLLDDVRRPLSVDQTVWPSCFPEATAGEWRGVLGLWSDFAAMSDAAAREGIDQTASRLVAAVVVPASDEERSEWLTKRLDQTVPERLGPDWCVLGYDVADQWLTSGLSNCGYVRNERAELQTEWARRLNVHHLFDDPEDARLFVKATNQRVPEHAPFFVYGLLERLVNPK